MAIADLKTPYSDGWWLKRLHDKLRVQEKKCEALQRRYEGNAPLPFVSDIQRDAVRWFVEKSRTALERVIVLSVLSRLRIRGIRTSVDSDEGGDGDAMKLYRASHGPLWSRQAMKMALVMSLSAVIVGKDEKTGNLIVTAEDPRLCAWISNPADPYDVRAGLKLFYDDVLQADVAYLYLPGRMRRAVRPRKRKPGSDDVRFNPASFTWDDELIGDEALIGSGPESGVTVESGDIKWLQEKDGQPVLCPLIPYYNEDGMGEFEPFIPQIDRINQQLLQRMTIATVQAFKQRALKGAPRKDPDTGEVVDYSAILTADPGAVWLIPETAEIWESGEVDLSGILAAIRDDITDLYATSGTPGYLANPDTANQAAESASLQREQTTFKVDDRKDIFEPSHLLTWQQMFRAAGDLERAKPGALELMWAPADRLSLTERASAVAQTKGVVPIEKQLIDIMGYEPAEAARCITLLHDDLILAQQMALAAAAAGPAPQTAGAGNAGQG